MSRGREENRALVVTDGGERDDHVRPVSISGLEQLVQVLRRDGTEHSAHEVLRAGLARCEDRELLRGLWEVLQQRLDERVGPDRRREIAALERRDDLASAEAAMQRAEQRLRAAEALRRAAEERVASSTSLRAHLPGRLGDAARREHRSAELALRTAREDERGALGELEACRPQLRRARSRRSRLEDLRDQQRARDAYLAEHREEADFAQALRRLLPSHEPRQRRTADDDEVVGHRAREVDAPIAVVDAWWPEVTQRRPPGKSPMIGR